MFLKYKTHIRIPATMALTLLIAFALNRPVLSQNVKVLTIDDAIQLAKKNNSDLLIAKMNKMQADEKVSEVYSNNLIPNLSLSSSYMRNFKKQFYDISLFGQQFSFSLLTDNVVTATLQVSEPIPILGTPVFSGIRIAETYSKLQDETVNQTEFKIKADVRKAFLNVLLLKEVVALNSFSLQDAQENLRVVESRYKTGIVTEFDFIRAQVKVETLKPGLSQAENNLTISKKFLKNTIGLKTDEDIDVKGTLDFDSTEVYTASTDGIVRKITEGSVAVRQLNLSRSLNEELVKVDRSALLPKFYLFGSYGLQALQDDGRSLLKFPFQTGISAGLGLSWDLNFIGNKYKMNQSAIEVKKTDEQIANVKDRLKTQTQSILLRLEDARNRIIAQAQTVKMAEKGLELANSSFKSGVINQIDVLEAELGLNQVKLAYLQAIFDYLNAKIELEQLLEK
jgi:outer membrane protein TolC